MQISVRKDSNGNLILIDERGKSYSVRVSGRSVFLSPKPNFTLTGDQRNSIISQYYSVHHQKPVDMDTIKEGIDQIKTGFQTAADWTKQQVGQAQKFGTTIVPAVTTGDVHTLVETGKEIVESAPQQYHAVGSAWTSFWSGVFNFFKGLGGKD